MRIYLLLVSLLLTTNLLFGQNIVLNGGFESVTCAGSVGFDFSNGCAGPGWNCMRRHPQLNLNTDGGSEYGPAAGGNVFAVLETASNAVPDETDAIFYNTLIGDGVTYGAKYDISFSAKLVTPLPVLPNTGSKLRFSVFALAPDLLFPDCDPGSFPNPNYGPIPTAAIPADNILFEEELTGDGIWHNFKVSKCLDPFTQFPGNAGPMVFVIVGEFVSSTGQAVNLGIDNFKVVEADCEAACSEDYNLNTCSQNNNMGYVHVNCTGEEFVWDLPSGSSAIVLDPSNGTAIVNASPGTYTLRIMGECGCEDVRTYTIVEDCCAAENECNPPIGLGCSFSEGLLFLNWFPATGAVSYEVQVAYNDTDCGCEPVVGAQVDYVTTNTYVSIDLPIWSKPCFSYRVRSICDDGSISDYSEPTCFNARVGSCFDPLMENPEQFRMTSDDPGMINQTRLSVFPNPASELINVEVEMKIASDLKIELMDLNGKIIETRSFPSVPVGVFKETLKMNVPAGIYFLNVSSDFEQLGEKIIFQ